MKKVGNIIFWAVVVGIVLIAMYTYYNKNKSNADVEQMPETKNEQTLESPRPESTKPENPKVPEFELEDIDGKTVKLSDYKGKIVVLNFWTTWCTYCIEEMPDFEELSKEFEKAGDAVVLMVNVQEDKDKVKNYLKKAGLTKLNVLLDENGIVSITYGISGFPNTFIIDKDGTLYDYIPGATNKEVVSKTVNKIR